MDGLMIKIDNVSKQYKLGQIGGTTLREELHRFSDRIRGKESRSRKIGTKEIKLGETFFALNGVSFEVKKGERVGIIGHNGAGKSTLLKLISRVTAPTSGTIGLNGRVASMLEVGTGFHGELTGRENIYMNGAILGMTKKEIDSKIEKIIDFSECRQFIDTPVKRYSSGMYVKLAFSVAAHLDSEIMIMDEVLAVGDMAFQKKCLEKMNEVSKEEGRTILYVSHNMNTIRELCERVIVLDHGKKVFDGGVEEGISAYLNSKGSSSVVIDYAQYKRPSSLDNRDIDVLKASFIGKNDVVFENDETMEIGLEWRNNQKVENAGLRIEIWSLSGIAQTTFELLPFYSGEKGQISELDVKLDISQLMNATYEIIFTFFSIDQYGNTCNLDCVHGQIFTVTPMKIGNGEERMWNTKNWGFIRMPDSAVLSLTVNDK